MKQDEPLMLASKGATGLFVAKSKEGQRPPGEPHVYGWAAMMTAMTTDPALSAEDKQKVVTYTSSANSPETLLQSIYWSQFKKNISEGLGQVAVFSGLPDSAHLVPHHQSHEIEGSQREVRPSSSGEATFANFNICSTICNASWRERRTAIADLLDTTEDAKYCTVGYRRQRRTEAAHLLDETEVIFSSNSVCRAGHCHGIHFSSS